MQFFRSPNVLFGSFDCDRTLLPINVIYYLLIKIKYITIKLSPHGIYA
jgi:hypothetical protein